MRVYRNLSTDSECSRLTSFDQTHDGLGPHHFQVDYREWDVPYREPGPFEDPNQMTVSETCLKELRVELPDLPEDVL